MCIYHEIIAPVNSVDIYHHLWLTSFFFLVVRTFKIYCVSNSKPWILIYSLFCLKYIIQKDEIWVFT